MEAKQQPSWSVNPHPLSEAELCLARNWLGTIYTTPRLLAKSLGPSLFVAAVTFSVVMAIGFSMFSATATKKHTTGLVGVVIAIAAGMLTMQRVFARTQKDNQRQASQNHPVQKDIDIRAGEAISVRAESVVEIAAVEGGGRKYCFQIAEDSAVVLRIPSADHSDFLAGNTRFPNQAFTIIRLPTSKFILKIDCTGEYLPVSAQLPASADQYQYRDAEPFTVEWDRLRAGDVHV